MIEQWIESDNISVAWSRAIKLSLKSKHNEVLPLAVSLVGFDRSGKIREDASLRTELDRYLKASELQAVNSVANTIFPSSLWNPKGTRGELFARYLKLLPRIRRASPKNRRGVYFERMLTGGPKGKENQLDFAIGTYRERVGVRRSMLQVGIFNPSLDHSRSALLGFPCLQHVTFAPTDAGLCVNALYANQYLVERAYGNYLGLCELGRFVAHELNTPLTRVTCFAGIAEFEPSSRKGMDALLGHVAALSV
jgi:hypothetical protein